ncbi:MAG: hypothetical protein ACTHMS_05135 [Jatrophihabitans sp.]|uniref:hypothetical protein n=1 Tax=Jatrophihabitans sp. TaxID=1932789 RepID=UPI003F8224F6
MLAARVAAAAVAASVVGACSSSGTPAAKDPATSSSCTRVQTVTKQLNSISTDLAASKRLFRQVSTEVAGLVADAPASLRPDAAKLQRSVGTVQRYVERATTIEQLQQSEQQPAVQDAFNDLLTAAAAMTDWHDHHC